MKDIVIIGAGGIGRETAWIIEEINEVKPSWNIVGFVDDNSEVWGKKLNGYSVLGSVDYLKSMEYKPYVIVAMANPKVKKDIVVRLEGEFEFATVIYPTVKISKYVEIGRGTVIYPNVILTVNTVIGDHVIISGNCGIGHDSQIGNYSTVLWGTNMSGYDVVEDECLIGIGCSLTQGKRVKKGSNVAANTVL